MVSSLRERKLTFRVWFWLSTTHQFRQFWKVLQVCCGTDDGVESRHSILSTEDWHIGRWKPPPCYCYRTFPIPSHQRVSPRRRLQFAWSCESVSSQVANSLTGDKVDFIPKEGRKVTWYTCGPTVPAFIFCRLQCYWKRATSTFSMYLLVPINFGDVFVNHWIHLWISFDEWYCLAWMISIRNVY